MLYWAGKGGCIRDIKAYLESHDEGLALNVGEGEVHVACVPLCGVSVHLHTIELTHDALSQPRCQSLHVPEGRKQLLGYIKRKIWTSGN